MLDRCRGLGQLREQRLKLDAAMPGRVGTEPSPGLRELPLTPDAVPAAGLVPRNGDVHEPLQEVALRRLRRPPGVLERLVRGEVLAAADQLDTALERVRPRP